MTSLFAEDLGHYLRKLARLIRPGIAVVTNVLHDHFAAFRSVEAIAAEKGRLVEALPPDGWAVLNADDPLVRAMGARTRARVVRYGFAADADVRAEDVRSDWPDRLSGSVLCDGRRHPFRARLCGTHHAYAVLAAAAVARALGVPVGEALAAMEAVPPFPERMCPLELPCGITFIEDGWKASLHSFEPVYEFVRNARAARKIAVIGTVSDYTGKASVKYRHIADRLLEGAERVVFVGKVASRIFASRAERYGGRLQTFTRPREANAFLRAFLKPGDFVFLKGSGKTDHLERFAMDRRGEISCWRERCGRPCFCWECRLRNVPG
jgi:UDP-N-acetylmuramyl pentapeptide synthase